MSLLVFILVLLGTYLLGAVPFGLLYSLMRGVDIRKTGSGNIGATNVSRTFGFWGGFLPVFLLDGLKGAGPVLLVRLIGVQDMHLDIAMLLSAAAAMLGHIFPVYLGFKGGKGVATGAGAFFVVAPLPALIALGVFLLAYVLTKVVAIGSILAAISLPISTWFILPGHWVLFWFCVAVVPLILYTHRKNISELLSGKKNNTSSKETS